MDMKRTVAGYQILTVILIALLALAGFVIVNQGKEIKGLLEARTLCEKVHGTAMGLPEKVENISSSISKQMESILNEVQK